MKVTLQDANYPGDLIVSYLQQALGEVGYHDTEIAWVTHYDTTPRAGSAELAAERNRLRSRVLIQEDHIRTVTETNSQLRAQIAHANQRIADLEQVIAGPQVVRQIIQLLKDNGAIES